ncbi:SDR family oxidoreductase [Liquorilactobacillus capillatus]|nr:SDR family oxidoreductase [Liquorilactobacillus capillatus]
MKYAVTGATGKFGRSVINYLVGQLEQGELVALVRNTAKAAQMLPQGVEIRQADYNDEKGLEQALGGIDRLLFISSLPSEEHSRQEQHFNVIEAAKKAGIKFIAYTSFPHADQAQSPLSADHKATEQALATSGLNYSLLRNNWYLENELDLIKGALTGQPFTYSAQNGRVGWALEREYAEGAARVLLSSQPKKIYEFSGQPLTFKELATAVAAVSVHQFEVLALDDNEYKKRLVHQGLPEQVAEVFIMIQTLIRNGELAHPSKDLEEVLGRQLMPLKKAIQEATH